MTDDWNKLASATHHVMLEISFQASVAASHRQAIRLGLLRRLCRQHEVELMPGEKFKIALEQATLGEFVMLTAKIPYSGDIVRLLIRRIIHDSMKATLKLEKNLQSKDVGVSFLVNRNFRLGGEGQVKLV